MRVATFVKEKNIIDKILIRFWLQFKQKFIKSADLKTVTVTFGAVVIKISK